MRHSKISWNEQQKVEKKFQELENILEKYWMNSRGITQEPKGFFEAQEGKFKSVKIVKS